MPASEYPFQMIGRVPVLTAPAEIDITTSGALRAILFQWHSRGHSTLVVNLLGTMYCDVSGLRELVRAHKRAVADGGGLRLVIRSDSPLVRAFNVSGLGDIIPHFTTVNQAVSQAVSQAVNQAVAEDPAAVSSPCLNPVREPGAARTSPAAHAGERHSLIAHRRRCEHCGAVFVPVREHGRFCTSDCRAAWNRGHLGHPAVDASALAWSIAAMSESTGRLPAVKVWDQSQAVAAIGEAVWWITMVDATLVRHHPGTYDTAMAARTAAERQMIGETMAGLRFVRNWQSREGLGDVIDTGAGTRRITGWTWKPVPEPALAGLSPHAQAWEQSRYRAYQARLAGGTIGKTFGRAVTFLTHTGADATSSTDPS